MARRPPVFTNRARSSAPSVDINRRDTFTSEPCKAEIYRERDSLSTSVTMGQSESTEIRPRLSTEQLSHELALRFATRCFTHLEIVHFKDIFKTLADHQDGVEYWKEETLQRFLCLPDALEAGSVLYQMATYLGAFPFPSLAPCILTREAMLKVVTIMTERYGKVLRRGKKDRVRLFFRSLAVFDRRQTFSGEKPTMDQLVAEQKPDDVIPSTAAGGTAGFAVDEPANDDLDEDEDDDELALAALDSLDAIEVFKEDQKVSREKKMHHAHVPVENLKRLLMLLLVMAPLGSQDAIAKVGEGLSKQMLKDYEGEVDSMLVAFDADEATAGIAYPTFIRAVSSAFPFLFDPLNALFEHFLFSKNIDLSKHGDTNTTAHAQLASVPSHINTIVTDSSDPNSILTPALVSHLSTFLITTPTSGPALNLFHAGAQFNSIYSTNSHGTSLSSFSRQVLSWKSASLLLMTGSQTSATNNLPRAITIGAFLPETWASHSSTVDHPPSSSNSLKPLLFILSPFHALFPSSPSLPSRSASSSMAYFSPTHGLALGCTIPPTSRTTNHSASSPIPGPVSLLVDSDIGTATFQHSNDIGGVFLADSRLDKMQVEAGKAGKATGRDWTFPRKIQFDIDALEVWGVSHVKPNADASPSGNELDEVSAHKARMAWDEAEAARRANVNFGMDKDGARQILELAGVIGNREER